MASTTPYRRSSRLASATPAPAAGSVNGSVSQSVGGARATPSRSTRGRLGPLPKVKVNQSHAYGSVGQIARAADIGIPSAGFGSAFDSHRESAIQRDEGGSSSRSSSSASNSPPPSQTDSRRSQIRESSELQEEIIVATEHTSVLDSSKSFGAVHEAGLHAEGPTGHAPPQPMEYQPSPFRILFRMIKRNWSDIFKALALLLGLFFVLSFLYAAFTSSSVNTTPISSFGEALKSGASTTWGSLKNGLSSGASVPSDIYSRVVKLEKSSKSHHKSIQSIERHLPEHIMVRFDESTGEPVIGDAFWRALRNKFSRERLDEKDAEWNEFLAANEIKIDNAIGNDRKKLLEHFDNTFRLAREKHQVLTRDDFMELMRKDYQEMSARVEREAERVARKIGSNAIRQQIELESLAYANLVRNSELSLKTVNFYSPGLGAKVNPRLTSPTQTKEVSLSAKLLTTMFWSPPRHPPITALERWEEASDCWCTAASNTHQAQLAVKMNYPIFPAKVTIENIPKEGTLNWKSAPKDLELWVEVKDAEKRESLEISWNELGKRPCSDAPPDADYVCIGSMMYNIHGDNHVQTFDLELDLEAHDIAVSNTVVRIRETWGSPWTCIYRLRMHGKILD